VEKSPAVSEIFSPGWTVPGVMLTSSRWKSSMSKDEAVELCLICIGLEPDNEVLTYEVASNDMGSYHVECRWGGKFYNWVAPLEYQVELREWKRRMDNEGI